MPSIRQTAALGLVVVLGAGAAFAASLAIQGGSLGMASASTPRCTTTGLGVIQNLSALTVISVTVSNVPATCAGATLQVTVNNTITSSGGSATVPGEGGSVTVSLATALAIGTVEQIDLVLDGP